LRFSRGILFLFAVSVLAWPQSAPTAKANPSQAFKTFTSPDGSFQFSYPDTLIRCELHPQPQGTGYEWMQPECMAYLSVCGDDNPTSDDPLVCIAYPSKESNLSSRLEAAAISFSLYAESEKDCFQGTKKIVEIHGVKFHAGEEGDGGMGHARDSRSYMTFHNGKCYAIAITDVTFTGEIDPPQPQLTKRDWAEIYQPLEQARDSFRFLK
jgi:hypothetical protein